LNEWRDRNDELLGAPIFLTPDEVRQLQDEGRIEITAE